jgi:hypothetical protein
MARVEMFEVGDYPRSLLKPSAESAEFDDEEQP